MNRQRLILAGLAGVLALSLVYAYLAMPRQETAPPRSAAPAGKAGVAARPGAGGKTLPGPGRLNLELPDRAPQPFPGAERDIFRFDDGAALAAKAPVIAAPPVEREAPPPPSAEQLLQKALASFRVLGYLDKGGTRSVFVTNDTEIFVVKAGKPFGAGNQFIVTEITATELVVTTPDRSTTARLPMGESGSREPAIIAPVSVPRPEVDVEAAPADNRAERIFNRPFGRKEGAATPADVPQPPMEESSPVSNPFGVKSPGAGNGEKE